MPRRSKQRRTRHGKAQARDGREAALESRFMNRSDWQNFVRKIQPDATFFPREAQPHILRTGQNMPQTA
jgi:hypothetical protein